MSKTFIGLAALLGTIIGAGIFGMPYVIMKSGYLIGLIEMLIIGIVMMITMLYLGEISLRTKTTHQLPGYAEKYLGKNGKTIMLLTAAFGIFSALLAYLIAEGESLSYLFFNSPNNQLLLGLAFWLVLSLITYVGIKALKEGESIGMILVFLTIISIAVYFSNKIDINNLKTFVPINFFAPFGVIMFAFLGFSAISEVGRILGNDRKPMKKIIIRAYIIVFAVYAIFTAIVLGFKGSLTPELATIALGKPFIFLGMLTMFTAYLALSNAIVDTIRFDFQKSKKFAWLVTILVPLALFIAASFIKSITFTKILGVSGVLCGGLTAVLVLLMVKNAKQMGNRTPEYSMPYSRAIALILGAFFILGVMLEIIAIIS
jgi:tyrosine-specific transport protein